MRKNMFFVKHVTAAYEFNKRSSTIIPSHVTLSGSQPRLRPLQIRTPPLGDGLKPIMHVYVAIVPTL